MDIKPRVGSLYVITVAGQCGPPEKAMPQKKRAQTRHAAASAAASWSPKGSDSEELEPAPRKRRRRGAVDEPCAPFFTVRIYAKPDWRSPMELKFREKIPFSSKLQSVRPIVIEHVEDTPRQAAVVAHATATHPERYRLLLATTLAGRNVASRPMQSAQPNLPQRGPATP